MSFSSFLSLPSLLLWTPFAMGILVLALPGRVLRGSAFLAAAAPAALGLIGHGAVAGSWMPAIGASYDLSFEGLSTGLVLITSVVALAAVGSCAPFDRRALASTLVAETGIAGALSADDVLLLLGFAGVAIAGISVLTGSRRFATVQWLGLGLVLAVSAFCYHEAWIQTGFPSTSLSRLQALVAFPELESWAFLFGATGPVIMMLGVRSGEGPERLFVAAYSLLPALLLFELVCSVFPGGIGVHAPLARALAIGFVLFACFAPRARLVLALQGVFLVGLFSLERDGLIAAEIEWAHMALACALWELVADMPPSRILTRLGALALVLVPPSGWLLPRSLSPSSPLELAALAGLWAVFGLRLWHASRRDSTPEAARARSSALALVTVVGMSLALFLAPAFYSARLEASLAPILRAAGAAEGDSE